MKYEEGEGSTYFTINFPVEIYANEPMADGTTTPHFTPKAEAFITAVTPPDWAYMALRGFIDPMLLKSRTTWNQSS